MGKKIDRKSQFENMKDITLFYLLKSFKRRVDEDTFKYPQMDDSAFIEGCDEAANTMGITLDYPLDHNYIYTLLELNPNLNLLDKKPSEKIIRPTRGIYSFDYYEERTEFVKRTYRHEIVSYCEDCIPDMIYQMETEGSFDYYSGNEVDVDYYDGETTDSRLDRNSITKIE